MTRPRIYELSLIFLFCAATVTTSPAQILTTLHSFDGAEGAQPFAGLVRATDGNFYGTTYEGGAHGDGTVFKITPTGTLTTLYSFCSQSGCADGEYLFAGLVQASDGNFYGTTWSGGVNGSGTVFEIARSGTLATLYSFDGTDGAGPVAGLVQGSDGNFYGTTQVGGTNGSGTVFKITPSGALTTLHSFDGADGSNPAAVLMQASDGNLYGTTEAGGANGNYGTVFKITPTGTLTTLYSFCSQSGCADGALPRAGLVQASDGDFYGTTAFGGANYYEGTVFKITPNGTLPTLHSFDGADGGDPNALVQASDGNFYGTTVLGGANGDNGTVFRLVPVRACLICQRSSEGE